MINYPPQLENLKELIRKELAPRIDADYVLWGLPYHTNIGDTLIWEGELEFLKSIPHKCLGTCGWNEYAFEPLKEDTIILIHGGGYFGDVWRDGWEYALDAIEHYSNHKIILLPNTIFYHDQTLMNKDAERLARLEKLVICARDKISYQLATQHFRNEVLLLPDMAFYIRPDYLRQWCRKTNGRTLYLKRIDKELGADAELYGTDVDVLDWPTFNPRKHPQLAERLFGFMQRLIAATSKAWQKNVLRRIEQWVAKAVYRPCLTRMGVEFISPYKKVYTTRLHVMILSILLGKEVEFVDNNYGKLSSYYATWLKDLNIVRPYQP